MSDTRGVRNNYSGEDAYVRIHEERCARLRVLVVQLAAQCEVRGVEIEAVIAAVSKQGVRSRTAADSPLVQQGSENQFVIGLGLNFTF